MRAGSGAPLRARFLAAPHSRPPRWAKPAATPTGRGERATDERADTTRGGDHVAGSPFTGLLLGRRHPSHSPDD